MIYHKGDIIRLTANHNITGVVIYSNDINYTVVWDDEDKSYIYSQRNDTTYSIVTTIFREEHEVS